MSERGQRGSMQLRQGSTLLGTLTADSGDMPWWHGGFHPTADFEPARPVFDAWSRAVRDKDEAAMGPAYDALKALDLAIVMDDGTSLAQCILYIDDDRFRLRY